VRAESLARRKSREKHSTTVAAGALVAAGLLGAALLLAPRKAERAFRASLAPPEGLSFWLESNTPGPAVISPDGRMLAFTAADTSGRFQLWVRPLEAAEPRPLAGTEGAQYPFWSPDSRAIGFFTPGKLKTIDVSGGSPLTLCTAAEGKGGAWSPAGVIVFAPGPTQALSKVSDKGGEPGTLSELDAKRGDPVIRRWNAPVA